MPPASLPVFLAAMGASLSSVHAAAAMTGEPAAVILTEMSGTWDVDQTMWAAAGAPPQRLAKAVARRTLAAGAGFVEEIMTPADETADPFTRTSHINYNAVDGRFEYFSIDTRAPQQMTYRSEMAAASFAGPFEFQGGLFKAREWGPRRNATFKYRVELTPVQQRRQRLTLYLTPVKTGRTGEFKAFEYSYVRRD